MVIGQFFRSNLYKVYKLYNPIIIGTVLDNNDAINYMKYGEEIIRLNPCMQNQHAFYSFFFKFARYNFFRHELIELMNSYTGAQNENFLVFLLNPIQKIFSNETFIL